MSARSECSSEFLTLNVTQTLVKRFDDPPNASTGPADELITPFPPSTTNGKGAVDDDGDITDDDDKEEEEEEDEEISDAVRRASAMLCVVRTAAAAAAAAATSGFTPVVRVTAASAAVRTHFERKAKYGSHPATLPGKFRESASQRSCITALSSLSIGASISKPL